MAPSKTTDLASIAAGFHALSDVTRIEILELLRSGERCVCELTDTLAAAQSRLSFHLRVLKDAGLVTDRREGRWVYYTLNHEVCDELESFLKELQTKNPIRSDSVQCCD
jgi:ArsR family transcriptional regulator, arsenate/arsenite/antimonite-responsive transcriptional repressor